MDISIKIGTHKSSASKDVKYIKITATVYSAEEASQLVNSVITNANATFDEDVILPGDERYDEEG